MERLGQVFLNKLPQILYLKQVSPFFNSYNGPYKLRQDLNQDRNRDALETRGQDCLWNNRSLISKTIKELYQDQPTSANTETKLTLLN